MPPRGFTNPAPKTESAREARKSFFCELCSKGYSRMNEFEAHESSYDHQHKKRLKEMKQMQRDPLASTKARKAERKADEKSGLITIKPVKLDSQSVPAAGSGFKKGGFKNAFGGEDEKKDAAGPVTAKKETNDDQNAFVEGVPVESDSDEDYEHYDPMKPTDCFEGCSGR
ncbi:MAG: hypothetical protein Q9187_008125 [Circinaria calcarea]